MEYFRDNRKHSKGRKSFRTVSHSEGEDEKKSFLNHGSQNQDYLGKSKRYTKNLENIKCFKCNQFGHYANKCPESKAGMPRGPPGESINKKISRVSVCDAGYVTRRVVVERSELESHATQTKDDLFRISAKLSVLDNGSEDLVVNIFVDTGSNMDIISEKVVKMLEDKVGPLSIVRGSPVMYQMMSKSHHDMVAGDAVEVYLTVDLDDHQLSFRQKLLIMPDSSEDILLGMRSSVSLGLVDYLSKVVRKESETTPESLWEQDQERNLFGAMLIQNSERSQESNETIQDTEFMDQIKINPSFPKLFELQQVILKHKRLFSGFDRIGLKVPPMSVKTLPGTHLARQSLRYISPKLLTQVKSEVDRMVSEGILEPTLTATGASPLVIVPKPDGSIRLAVDYRELNSILVPYGGTLLNMKSLFPVLANKSYYCKLDNLWGYHQLKIFEDDQDNTSIITHWGLFKFTRCSFGISTAPAIYQDRMANVILKDLFMEKCVVFIDDTISFGDTADDMLSNLDMLLQRMEDYNVRLKPSKCQFGFEEVEFVGHIFNKHGYHMSDLRKQGILDLRAPQNLKQLRSFLGMVNYFRDFIPNLSEKLSSLTKLTATTKNPTFIWGMEQEESFIKIKDEIMNTAQLHHLNDEGKIVLYSDASQLGIGATLTQQDEHGIERPILFISHKFSEAAQKWSTIEQECFAFYYSILKLQQYLLGRHFFVATDHRNLVYLEKSTVPKLVRWRLRLLEFDFTVIHVPGKDNVIADSLSRLNRIVQIPKDGSEISEDTDDIISRIHNVIMGHLGISKTFRKLSELGYAWPGMKSDISKYIQNCPTCQKIKIQPIPVVQVQRYTLAGHAPMQDLSVDSIGPLPEDESENKYILVFIDNFSKYVELFATKSVDAMSYVHGLLRHIGYFGVMKSIRSDGGTQFTAQICSELANMLKFKHNVILPYHPEANGIVERRNAEVMKHLRALIVEGVDKGKWSLYLPLIQRILNFTYDESIGTYPAQLIFGDQLPVSYPLLFEEEKEERVVGVDSTKSYIDQLNQMMLLLIKRSNNYVKQKEQNKIQDMKDPKDIHVFQVGEYVLVEYPTRPPHKLSPVYRGPLKILEIIRDDIFQLLDLTSGKKINMHVDRLRIFHGADNLSENQLLNLSAKDKDEYNVEAIIDHSGTIKQRSKMMFRVRWQGYDESEDTWLPYTRVKDLVALDLYVRDHIELKGL
jgi:hypothetical protein